MLPTLFISHGSPMLAVEPGVYGCAWKQIADSLPRPRAILVVSAHWTTHQPVVSTAAQPVTIHDFGGFPSTLYDIHYPAPGAPVLAERVQALLSAAGVVTSIAPDRGLDHGAWVPLRHMYPDADIPVTQLSVQPGLDAAWHMKLGEVLRPLREEGVLILGSGSLTHNLYEAVFDDASVEPSEAYAREFQSWLHAALVQGERDALHAWQSLAPHAERAHPTPEHLLPIFVAYGAGGGHPEVERPLANFSLGVLAMDCYVFS
jgi:4,5-DOPA dioxygenase extradiol